jgi:hypothetical protein
MVYDWKRYWVPRDGGFSFDSDGFLLPPPKDSDDFVWWKTDVTAFEDILTKPCLVLLGEPGIGKSFAIRDDKRSGSFDSVKVIIELKGCWHPKVKTAMGHQLVDRYLADNECRYGLYVVGWFPLESWNKDDSRRKRVPFKKRNDLESYLAKQAESVSSELIIRAIVLDFSIRTSKNPARQRAAQKKKSSQNRSLPKKR